jgi:hypothetical protein
MTLSPLRSRFCPLPLLIQRFCSSSHAIPMIPEDHTRRGIPATLLISKSSTVFSFEPPAESTAYRCSGRGVCLGRLSERLRFNPR